MTVEVHNPDQTESKPLNTELETLAPEAIAEPTELSPETHSTRPTSDDAGSTLDIVSASSGDSASPGAISGASPSPSEPDYDAADFAAALANFDREQAAETAAAQNLTTEEVDQALFMKENCGSAGYERFARDHGSCLLARPAGG